MSNGKWILAHISKFKALFLISGVLLTIQTGLEISLTGLQKYVIDDVFSEGRYELLPTILITLVIVVVIYSVFFTVVPYMTKVLETRIYSFISKDLLRNLHKLTINKIQEERTARYVQLMTSDVKKVSVFIGVDIFSGVRHAINILILGVIIGLVSFPVLIFVLLLSIIYIYVGKKFAPRLRGTSNKIEESRADLLVHIEEGISATREVISYNQIETEKQQYHSLFDRYFKRVMNEAKLFNKYLLFSGPLKWGVRLLVFCFGGWALFQGNITLGVFVVVFQFSSSLIDEINNLFLFISHISINFAYIDRIRSLQNDTKISEGTISLIEPVRQITFENVSFSYSGSTREVLSNITIDIPIGKKIAFVGASGGGKSTVIQLLMRFFEPTAGEIRVNGFDLKLIKREDWSNKVSVVFQDPYLLPDTVMTNLLFGADLVDKKRVQYYCKAVKIDDVIESLSEGYDTVIGERGITLSGGQRQRLAIARALIRNTEILICDEATSSLDIRIEREVQHQIDTLRKRKTTIIIAHRLSTIVDSDIIYVVDNGQIVGSGTHESLLKTSPVYSKLYVSNKENENNEINAY